jgi:hypothetical protein
VEVKKANKELLLRFDLGSKLDGMSGSAIGAVFEAFLFCLHA